MATSVGDVHVSLTGDARKLNSAMSSAKKSTSGLKESVGSLMKVLGPLGAMVGGGVLVKGFLDSNRSAQKLQASLKTLTGSTESAADAFRFIENISKQLPESVEDTAQAFIRMKSLGLDPSEEALISYGNTAAAMGMDLMQMVEAVADATTGEFERLKEFGITSKSEGEKVSLTFQGVTTTVKKNAEDINEYLKSIGEVQFAGAAADQMDPLDGALSNLEVSLGALAREIGAAGVNDLIMDVVKALDNMVQVVLENKDGIRTLISTLGVGARILATTAVAFGTLRVAMLAYTVVTRIAATSTLTLKTAVRSLMASSGIGLLALGAGILAEFLVPWEELLGTKEKTDDLADSAKKWREELDEALKSSQAASVVLPEYDAIMTDLAGTMETATTGMDKFQESALGPTMMSGLEDVATKAAWATTKFGEWSSATDAATDALKHLADELIRLAAQRGISWAINTLFSDRQAPGSGSGYAPRGGVHSSGYGGGFLSFLGGIGSSLVSGAAYAAGKGWMGAQFAADAAAVGAADAASHSADLFTFAPMGKGGGPGPVPVAPTRAAAAGGVSVTVNVAGSVGVDDIGEQLVKTLRGHGI